MAVEEDRRMFCVFSFGRWKLTRKVLEDSLLEIAETVKVRMVKVHLIFSFPWFVVCIAKECMLCYC